MHLRQKIVVENKYAGNGWDFEKTTKYVFEMDQMLLEAGYFEHYLGEKFVKAVVELPVSYGCPAHCKFCATSAIETFRKLTPDQMTELMDYIWMEQRLEEKDYVLLSVTGTGDLQYNFRNVKQFLERLAPYHNLHVTVSSCLWNAEALSEIERLSEKIAIRNVQITYVSDDEKVLGSVIPVYLQKRSCLDEVLAYLKHSGKRYYRINYIMIHNVNDSEESFHDFANKIKKVRDQAVVRIAKLNETEATKRNGLWPAGMEKMTRLQEILDEQGVRGYLFYSFKNDSMNCGQLVTERKVE